MNFYKTSLSKGEDGLINYPTGLNLNDILIREYNQDYTEMVFGTRQELTGEGFTAITETEFDEAKLNYEPVEVARKKKITELKAKCTEAFYAGFTSTVTRDGKALVFGYEDHDQRNFTKQSNDLLFLKSRKADGKLTEAEYSLETVIRWKSKNMGVVTLNEDEFYQITRDIKKHEMTVQGKYWTLEASVLAATTSEQVNKISW
jgi:hypothetical protein